MILSTISSLEYPDTHASGTLFIIGAPVMIASVSALLWSMLTTTTKAKRVFGASTGALFLLLGVATMIVASHLNTVNVKTFNADTQKWVSQNYSISLTGKQVEEMNHWGEVQVKLDGSYQNISLQKTPDGYRLFSTGHEIELPSK